MSGEIRSESADVVVVGGGPSGLAAASALRREGASVLVLEREADAGGIPRHSDHTGYGLRDLHAVMTGPRYARRCVDAAVEAGADVRALTMVTGWTPERSLLATGPGGRIEVSAGAIVLATGARERSRPARGVAGDRPRGVLTTGQLQNLVHLHPRAAARQVGSRAVVVGAELVSWSAVLTLRAAGCEAVLMTSAQDRPESYAALTVAGRALFGLPVSRRTRVVRILGRDRVEAVELERTDTGQRRILSCDTIVFTGDWIPDSELARLRGVAMDPGYLGPVVDAHLRTSVEGVFAIGNLVHPVATADVAALDGRRVVAAAMAWLREGARMDPGIRIRVEEPLLWISPGLLRSASDAHLGGRLLAGVESYRAAPRIVVHQSGRQVASLRVPWSASPGRVFRIPWSVVRGVVPGQGDVVVGLA